MAHVKARLRVQSQGPSKEREFDQNGNPAARRGEMLLRD